MSITKRPYLKINEDTTAEVFELKNSKGMSVEITNFGGIILTLNVPDRNGKLDDVVLGFDKPEDYLVNNPHFGAIIGRFANRIEFSEFELNGQLYKVAANDGKNHLHGGLVGFDKVLWQAETKSSDDQDSLILTYTSKDMEEGYPGKLDVEVIYVLTSDNALEIHYKAVTDKDTVINLTNHSYFNLSGHASGDILKHQIMLKSDTITENDEFSIPTGKFIDVAGTPMDFRKLTTIGDFIEADYEQIKYGSGFDHNWIVNVNGKTPELIAEVYDGASGRVMETYTTKPGVQLYTGNFLNGSYIGKGKAPYNKRNGLCLETQFYPNSIKHKHFPSPILKAGEEYNHVTIYKFSTK